MRHAAPAALIAGAASFAAGLYFEPARAWAALLVAGFAVLALGLAGTFFLALQFVTNSKWSIAVRRVPEAMTHALPFGAAAVLAALALGGRTLYPWAGGTEHLTGFKAAWLEYPFFLARAVAYVAVWLLLSRAMVRNSRAQDRDGDPQHTARNIRLSAIFIVVFAFTLWLASYDWLMALEPGFASTIFGVYQFAGLFQAGIAAMIVLSVWLHRQHMDFRLRPDHMHDLGKLLFAFSTFWMYIWFSQYMLLWYANLPEEVAYFVKRSEGRWAPLFLLNMVLNWCVPFVVLLPKRAKRNATTLARVGAVVLAGRWLDLHLTVVPSASGNGPVIATVDVLVTAAGAAVFWLAFRHALVQAPLVPRCDPALEMSLTYHA